MKFSKDTTNYFYTYAAFALLAVSGLVMNAGIVYFYDTKMLGVFNQVYAVFIMTSQLAGIGLQYSVLKHSTQFRKSPKELSSCIWSNVILACLFGIILVATIYMGIDYIYLFFDSELVMVAVKYSLVGVVLYNINKSLLFALNGLSELKTYSIGQSIRYLVMMVYVIATSALRLGVESLALVFPVAECVLFFFLVYKVVPIARFDLKRIRVRWLKKHFWFGVKGGLSGILLEMNTRVDVLMLGYFTSDSLVGIYSFASMFAEGACGVLAVVRTNINPKLVEPLAEKRFEDVRALVALVQRRLYPAMLAFLLVVMAGFYFVADIFLPSSEGQQSLIVLGVLFVGIFIFSGYSPFVLIFAQAGRPGTQTIYYASIVCTNIFLNAVLIPILGVKGAALATAISFVLSIVWLYGLLKRHLGFSPGSLLTSK